MPQPTATLLVTCPERKGLVARLAGFVADNGGNIVQSDHHTDTEAGLFLSRIEWELQGFGLQRHEIGKEFERVAQEMGASWRLRFSDDVQRIAVLSLDRTTACWTSCGGCGPAN